MVKDSNGLEVLLQIDGTLDDIKILSAKYKINDAIVPENELDYILDNYFRELELLISDRLSMSSEERW